jgi:uncharacterized membrane protein YphA (DoxX/SURF4 family)
MIDQPKLPMSEIDPSQCRRTAPYAALLLRLVLSFFFFAHLYRKFAVTGYEDWFNGWIKAGYLVWTLHYTLIAEFAGATLQLVGVSVSQLWLVVRGSGSLTAD